MKIFILGGTGSIGSGLVKELSHRSHDVIALSRSMDSDAKLESLGAQAIRGDLYHPEVWASMAASTDAVIHVASTFGDDMERIDNNLIDALIKASNDLKKILRLFYTGGCWLYGETGDNLAHEGSVFNPLPYYQWMVAFMDKLLNSPSLSTTIIHPAMVYHEEGGVFDGFLASAKALHPFEVWGNLEARWPLIERSDLACAYADLLEQPQLTGHFNVSSEQGVYVSDIIATFSQHYAAPLKTVVLDIDELVAEYGAWAAGPAIDQQMSSAKLRRLTTWKPLIDDYRFSALFS